MPSLQVKWHEAVRHGLGEPLRIYLSPLQWILETWRNWSTWSWSTRFRSRIQRIGPSNTPQRSSTGLREANGPRWNLDVLENIFYLIPQAHLPSVALVCREWALAAQRPLYTSLHVDTGRKHDRRLVRTIRTSPHLRPLIQTISLTLIRGEEKPSTLSWLQLIPDGSVHTLHAMSCAVGVDFATPILAMPFVHSLRRIRCRGNFILTEAHMLSCLQLPLLETLSLSIPENLRITALISVASRLRRLSIWSPDLPLLINPLLHAVGSQLERLDIDIGVDPPSVDRISKFLTTMVQSLSQLRQLSLQSEFCPEAPFADRIPQLMPSLEYLHLGYGMFSSALWSNLTRRLRVLRLEHTSDVDFPFNGMKSMFEGAGRGEIGLQSLAIFARGLKCDPTPFVEIGDAYQDCNVDFTIVIYDPRVSQWKDGEFSCSKNATIRSK